MATLASKEHGTELACCKELTNLQITRIIKHISCSVLHEGTTKRGYVRAGSTVTLSVLPLHIAITQTRPHLRSAVCRSIRFATSINNFLSQRGWRPASCIADVDWLKVWVQLVVRGRNEQYRDAHLNRVVIVRIEMNSWMWLCWHT
jgi:hypothetical protein